MMWEARPPPEPDLPQLPRSSSLHAVPTTPVDRVGACRFLPHSRGLPRLTGGSASTTSLLRNTRAGCGSVGWLDNHKLVTEMTGLSLEFVFEALVSLCVPC